MSVKEKISSLRKINKYFMNHANEYLNTTCEQLQCKRPSIKFDSDTIEKEASSKMSKNKQDLGLNNNVFMLNPVKRQQYENWKKRNDSQQINASKLNLSSKSDNTYLDNRSLNRSFTNLSVKSYPQSSSTPKKLLVSNKKYSKTIPNRNHTLSDIPSTLYRNKYKSHSDLRSNKEYVSINSDYESSDVDCNESVLSQIDSIDLEGIKHFRDKYYFECHSVKKKLQELNNLKDKPHKCQHEFVVNDRLFFDPIYKDHQNNSRCRHCHLTLNAKKHSNSKIHLCKLAKSSTSSSFETLSVDSSKDEDAPEIVIKFPYRNDLVIPQWKIDKNVSQKSNAKNRKPSHSYDSMALKYQKNYRDSIKK